MNPEFKRNLWLEITPTRLAIMPAVLALIGLLVVALNEDDAARSLFTVFSALFFALTAGWGSLLVLSSINDEVGERTWDQQRLSALSAWQMAWGKLFGSTAYAWYGGALCAAVAVLSALAGPDFWGRCTWLLVGVLGTVALHAWLLASRLHTMDVRTEKTTGMAARLFGLLLLVQSVPLIFMVLRDPLSPERDDSGGWWNWGLPLNLQWLLVNSLLLALGLLALWRSMGKQLMVRAVPWAWGAGVLALGLVVAGFEPRLAGLSSVWLVLAATALVATYLALFTEANNRLVWQAVFFHVQQENTRRMWQTLPLWPVSWALAALLTLLFTGTPPTHPAPYAPDLAGVLGLVVLHCLRDCGIYHFFALRDTPRKPAGMTLITLFVLGVVLPGLVSTASPDLARWFEPLFGLIDLIDGDATLDARTWAAMAAQVMLVAGLVAWRWRAGTNDVSGTQPL